MKNHSFLLSFYALIFVCLSSSDTLAQNPNDKLPSFIINEVHSTKVETDDVFIELVVTNADEISHNTGLSNPKVIIDDSNEGPTFNTGFISIKEECLSSVRPGDIIVIHGLGADISNVSEKVILFSVKDECIIKWNGAPSQGNSTYTGATIVENPEAKLTDFIKFRSNKNEFQVRTNEVYFNKLKQNGSRNYSLATADLNTYQPLAKSLGKANSAANAEMINTLASQSALRISCELIGDNTASISIDPGNPFPQQAVAGQEYTGPYTMETPIYTEKEIEVNSATAYGLECGDNTIIVTDIHGRSGQCMLNVMLEDEITVQVCKESTVDIQALLCENIESECISFKKGNEEVITPIIFEEIPNVIPTYDDYPVIIKYSDKKGNIVHEVSITIDVINPGETCDDGDECTENDMYDESCNCIGESVIPEIELIVEDDEPCKNSPVKFSLGDTYDSYLWMIDGYVLGEESEFETTLTGIVDIEVSNNDCSLTYSHEILDMGKENVEITSSADFMCSESTTPVTLTIDLELSENCEWYDEFGELIATNTATVDIPHEGTYRVKIVDCEKEGSIHIRGNNFEDYKLTPTSSVLCEGGSVELSLEPTPPVGYTMSWSIGNENGPMVTVSEADQYAVTVTSPAGCEYVDKVEVLDPSDTETIHERMIAEGFDVYEFVLPGNFNKSGAENSSRSGCEFINYSDIDVNLQSLDNPAAPIFSLESNIQATLNLGCESCNYDAGAYIGMYTCDSEEFDLEDFLSVGSANDGSVKALMVEDEANDKLLIYYNSTILPRKDCVNPNEDHPELAKDIIYDILCGVKSEDATLQLNYQVPFNLTSFKVTDITLLAAPGMLENQLHYFSTIKVANFKVGGTIDLPSSNEINPTNIDRICIDEINVSESYPIYPVYDFTYTEDNYWKYEFDYNSCQDPFDKLIIYIHDSEKDAFHNILTELTKIDESPHTVFNPQLAIDQILQGTEFIQYIEQIPNCLLTDDILCTLITELVAGDHISEVARDNLAELLETNSEETAMKIMSCIHNEAEQGPYLVDDIKAKFGFDYKVFQSLAGLYYTLNSDLDPTTLVNEQEIYEVYSSLFDIVSLTENYTDRYSNVDFSVKRSNPIGYLFLDPVYEIKDNFYHYAPYLVTTSDLTTTLPQWPGFTMGTAGVVPGLYVPLLLDDADNTSLSRKFKAAKQTILTLGLIATTRDLGIIYRAGELYSLRGAFAIGLGTFEAFDLMATSESLCTGMGIDEWCENWNEVSSAFTVFALTGRVLTSKTVQMHFLKNKWNESGSVVKSKIKARYGDNVVQYFDDLFGAVDDNLTVRLNYLYPNNPDKIDELVSAFNEDGWFLATDEIAAAINQTSDGGLALFDDLLNTVGNPGKIGGEMSALTTGRVFSWVEFKNTGLRTNVDTWLPAVSKWIDESYEFIETSGGVIVKSSGDEVLEIVGNTPKWTKHKVTPKPNSSDIRTAEEVNPEYVAKGWDPPYDQSYPAIDFKTANNESFVRVFSSDIGNVEGAFIMKQSDLSGLTPIQIKNKFALDYVPDKILDVNVPSNFSLRTGKVAPRINIGSGGKTQFELREDLASSYFVNVRNL